MAKLASGAVALMLGAAGLVAASAAASADGYGRRAPPSAGGCCFTWSGLYFGVNVGGAWGHSDYDHTPTGEFPAGEPGIIPNLVMQGSGNLDPSGAVGGGQVGYNWQLGNIVFGLEADAQGWSLTRSRRAVGPGDPLALGTTLTIDATVESNRLFTLRPRAGIAFGHTFVYATGGLAVANVRFDQAVFFSASGSTASGYKTNDALGWTVGGGVEYAFGSCNCVSVKAEYLYIDFPNRDQLLYNPDLPAFTHNVTDDLSVHVVRVGLNWKLGDRREARLN
jgi:outer membrane immunogenic protein